VLISNWDLSGILLSRQLLTERDIRTTSRWCLLRNWDTVQEGHLRTVDKSTLYTAVNSVLKKAKMACATEVAS
jgi:hypothetical protein